MKYFLPSLLILFCLSRMARGQDVQPNSPSSHEGFIKLLNASRDRSRHHIIAGYDAFLAASPSDHLTAIERCKFIVQSFDENEEETEPSAPSCNKELETRYGQQPAVVLYRLETMWGEPALQYATGKLADRSIEFTAAERASLLGVMADRQHGLHHLKEASQLGEQAQRADAKYDATFVIADYLRSIGARQRALDVLAEKVGDDHNAPSLLKKARLLFDLDDPATALTAIRAASRIGGGYVDPVFEGRVLEALEDTDGARAAYAKQARWNQREVLTRLFYLDLKKKNAALATASYRSLRDLGWNADPMGRHRVALALAHPGAPWMLRELTGLLGFFALVLLGALLPACVALPVHYAGLIRRSRGAAQVHSRWTLRDGWIAFSLMLISGLLAIYGFAYEDLASLVDEHGKANLSQVQLAHVGVVSFTFTALTAMSFSRRIDWQGLAPAAWLNRATIGTAAKYLFVLLLVAWINRLLLFSSGPTAPDEGITLSTLAALRAIRTTYGPGALLFFAVIVAPLSEEFLFRGVILQGLTRHIPFWWANGVQACLFAFVHDNLKMAPFLIVMAILVGILRRRTQSLATGTVLHAMNNLLASFAIAP